MIRSDVEQKSDIIISTSSFSGSKGRMKDHEGLILVPPQPDFFVVVDCPSLHIVDGNNIGPQQQSETDAGFSFLDHASCPECQHVISRARQVIAPALGHDMHSSKIGSGEMQRDLRQYISPLPEVVPIQTEPTSRGGSISADTLKPKRFGIFSRFISAPPAPKPQATIKPQKLPRSAKSITSLEIAGSTLPPHLSFCFSLCGNNLILWKKDSPALVRIEVETRGSRLINLTEMLPTSNEVRTVNIRNVAEGKDWICALISHNRQLILLVLHCSGLLGESSMHYVNEQVDCKALTISPDNSFVAAGFGTRIHLYKYQGCHQQWQTILTVPDFTIPAEVKFQVVNFSSDNAALIVATQRHDILRSTEDDTISTYVWSSRRRPPPPQKMSFCKMPTDNLGVVSINYSPALSLSLILGASSTPYPLFLSPADTNTSPIPPPPTMTDFRVRCVALSPPPNTHLAYMMDFRNRIFRIDIRARSVTGPIADLNLERGVLHPREEQAVIGVSSAGKVRVFWRRGSGLWVCTIGDKGDKEVWNLRGVWEDAGGGG